VAEHRARRVAMGVALVGVGATVTLGVVIARLLPQQSTVLLFGLPASAAPVLLAPWLLLLGAGILFVSFTAGRRAEWARGSRLQVGLVALSTLALAAAWISIGLT
jgi:hypothetical protein